MAEEEFEYESRLPYGIVERPIYYICLKCGREVSKAELDSMPSKTCPHCGYRVFVKPRTPPAYRAPRKIYSE